MQTISTFLPTTFTLTVGNGGAVSASGSNSVLSTTTSIGGGRGSP